MSAPTRLAIVGLGKIAHDQHVPSILASPDFDLVATVSLDGEGLAGRPTFRTIEELADAAAGVDAVAVCTPPQVRRAVAAAAIGQGWHVFLEKPPAATLSEVEALTQLARARGTTLFASWHSRYSAGVATARDWLSSRLVHRARITWREDVRTWHPGQDWIFEAGGLGVFDPGVNALSIATELFPGLFVADAEINIPANRAAPIAARVELHDISGAPIVLDLDFLQQGKQSWDIEVETDAETLSLTNGGAMLRIGKEAPALVGEGLHGEYTALYARFSNLVRSKTSDVDVAPLRLVADAFLRARINAVEAFDW